jgi:hypothetical protein
MFQCCRSSSLRLLPGQRDLCTEDEGAKGWEIVGRLHYYCMYYYTPSRGQRSWGRQQVQVPPLRSAVWKMLDMVMMSSS